MFRSSCIIRSSPEPARLSNQCENYAGPGRLILKFVKGIASCNIRKGMPGQCKERSQQESWRRREPTTGCGPVLSSLHQEVHSLPVGPV